MSVPSLLTFIIGRQRRSKGEVRSNTVKPTELFEGFQVLISQRPLDLINPDEQPSDVH